MISNLNKFKSSAKDDKQVEKFKQADAWSLLKVDTRNNSQHDLKNDTRKDKNLTCGKM